MRMSAERIRSINRSIARVNGIICGASDSPRRVPPQNPVIPTSAIPSPTVKIVAAPKPINA